MKALKQEIVDEFTKLANLSGDTRLLALSNTLRDPMQHSSIIGVLFESMCNVLKGKLKQIAKDLDKLDDRINNMPRYYDGGACV